MGYTKEELATISWAYDLTPPEWQDFTQTTLKKISQTGIPAHYIKEYIRKDGSRIAIDLFVHVIKDKAGKIQHLYAFITDLAKLDRANEKFPEWKMENNQIQDIRD